MKHFISLSALAVAALLAALLCTVSFAADKIVFTKQPTGAAVENGTDVTVTFETNVECRCLLQGRENETYDWGNYDYVESPFTILGRVDTSEDFRIIAWDDSGGEYYSDIFKVTWKSPDDITEITLDGIDFGTFAYGTDIKPVPLVIKNTGAYTLRSPSVEVGWDERDYIEIIQNKEPHDIKPGETDSETWSVRPTPNLGSGDYYCYIYVRALNISEGISDACICRFEITGGGEGAAISARDIDLGNHTVGYTETVSVPLTVSASGDANLHNVHIKLNSPTFFRLSCTYLELYEMKAGTTSGNNWEVVLQPGLPSGYYEHVIEVWADEVKEPFKVTVRANIADPSVEDETGAEDQTHENESSSFPWWIIAVAAAAVIAVCAAVIIIKKKK